MLRHIYLQNVQLINKIKLEFSDNEPNQKQIYANSNAPATAAVACSGRAH